MHFKPMESLSPLPPYSPSLSISLSLLFIPLFLTPIPPSISLDSLPLQLFFSYLLVLCKLHNNYTSDLENYTQHSHTAGISHNI